MRRKDVCSGSCNVCFYVMLVCCCYAVIVAFKIKVKKKNTCCKMKMFIMSLA